MQRKSKKRGKKKMRMKQMTKKQKLIMMIGCSNNKNKNKKISLGNKLNNKSSSKCGQNGDLNHRKQKGGLGTGFNNWSSCGSCGCPMSPLPWEGMALGNMQKGGSCTTCSGQSGGSNFFKPAGPTPGPISGLAWNTSVKEWPTMNGIGGDRNYLASYASSITKNPQLQMSMSGSGYKTANSMVGGNIKKHKRHNKTNKRGGGFIPSDLLNLGRNFNYSINSTYNTLKGYNPPVNHLPYKDQLTGALNKGRFL